MSIKHVQFALDGVPGLSAAQRLTLVSLGEWANDDGVCWPSHDTIARRVGVSRRQVMRLLEHLERIGVLERVERKQHSNVYRITCDIAMSHVTSDTHVTSEGSRYDIAMSHVTPMSDVTFRAPDVTPMSHQDVTSATSRCDIAMSPEPPVEPSVRTTNRNHQRERSEIHQLVDAWAERRGFQPTNWSKASKIAKNLDAAGVTPEELMEMYEWFEADPFWSDKGFDLGTALSQVEKFRQSKRTPKRLPKRKPSGVEETTRRLLELDARRRGVVAEDEADVFETTGAVIR